VNISQKILMECSRRELLKRSGLGIGSAALATLLAEDLGFADQPATRDSIHQMAARATHFPARAKSVIFLHMVGAPSQLDLFEDKPVLRENDDKPCPDHLLEGQRFAFLRGHPKLMGSRFKFSRHGESGQVFSELLPHISGMADDIAILKTLHTEQFNHAPAQLFMQTGFPRFGRPCMGSWATYGLGSENRDLPGFVVLITGSVGGAGNSMWGSGFLPTLYQGVEFRSKGDPVLFLSNPAGMKKSDRRRIVDVINRLNAQQLEEIGDPEIATRIGQYEMAFRMQASVPELMDISQESKQVHEMYGTTPGSVSFANNCLLARRLVERGVRFVQLFDQGWDHHGSLQSSLANKCRQVDRPVAALLKDLKRRGLLDETLVVWGSEFGRTPMLQNDRAKGGRDHHKDAFCIWMAGGGIKGGVTVGETDDLGYFPVKDPVSVHDFHATLLHLLGVDHERLTYRFQGRPFRLTDVAGNVVRPIIA
tara:strand:+ start:614 stop:2050 length:1437 start_codon:yes stop_codon:yes gene_type:complete